MPSQAEIGFLIFLRCYTGAWSHDILLHSRLSSWSGIFCCTLDCHPGQEENEAAAKLSKLQQAWQMLFLHVSARSARLENLFSYPHVVALIWLHWTGWPLAAVGGPRMSTNLVGEQMCVCVRGWLHIFIQQCMGMERWGSIQRSSSYAPRISPATLGDVPATRSFFDIAPRLSSNLASRFPIS